MRLLTIHRDAYKENAAKALELAMAELEWQAETKLPECVQQWREGMRGLEPWSVREMSGNENTMNTVYIITHGCYSDYSIESVWSTREAADAEVLRLKAEHEQQGYGYGDSEVEEWFLDEPLVGGIPVWRVTFRGDATECHRPEGRIESEQARGQGASQETRTRPGVPGRTTPPCIWSGCGLYEVCITYEELRTWCHGEMRAASDTAIHRRAVAILKLLDVATMPPWLADAAEALGEVRPEDGAPLALNWTQVITAIHELREDCDHWKGRAESAEYALAPHLGKNGHVQREPQSGYGEPGVRDPNNRCDMFSPGKPTNGGCQGDGHYLCAGCMLHEVPR